MRYQEEYIDPLEIIRRREAIKAGWDEETRQRRLVCKPPSNYKPSYQPRIMDLGSAGLSDSMFEVVEYYG